jgi:uncharacterized protein (TIGR02217 family)
MFNDTRLLEKVAYGSTFGGEFNTRIIRLKSGHERRNANWSMPLHRYSILYQALDPADHILVKRAHYASLGAAIGFRFKDWTDYQATNESLGVGTGVEQTIQLIKTYTFGSISLERNIYKPVNGTVTVSVNGTPIVEDSTNFIDYDTGILTITAAGGATITWTGEFDVPVRFENDRLDSDPIAPRSNGFLLSSDVDLIETRDIE